VRRSTESALDTLSSPNIEAYPSPPSSSTPLPTFILLDKTHTIPVPQDVASKVQSFSLSYNVSLPYAYAIWLEGSRLEPRDPKVAAERFWSEGVGKNLQGAKRQRHTSSNISTPPTRRFAPHRRSLIAVLKPLRLLLSLIRTSQHSGVVKWIASGSGIGVLCNAVQEWCNLGRYTKETKQAGKKRELCKAAAVLGADLLVKITEVSSDMGGSEGPNNHHPSS